MEVKLVDLKTDPKHSVQARRRAATKKLKNATKQQSTDTYEEDDEIDEDMDEDEESSYLNGAEANEGQTGANRRQRRGTGLRESWNRKIKQLRFDICG